MTATHRTEMVPLGDISLAPENPKRHDIERIKGSIRRFGITVPALRDERTGVLAAGHGRTIALREMQQAGRTHDKMWPPSGVTVGAAGTWLVPVTCGWASLNDTEAKAYLAADNRLSELGGWDTEALANLAGTWDTDLAAAVGFQGDELAGVLAVFDTAPAVP